MVSLSSGETFEEVQDDAVIQQTLLRVRLNSPLRRANMKQPRDRDGLCSHLSESEPTPSLAFVIDALLEKRLGN